MEHELRQAGELAAAKALGQLALTSFGAVDELSLMELSALSDGQQGYWLLRWEASSMGLIQSSVSMVILPEFLVEDNAQPQWLAEQMASFILEKVQEALERARHAAEEEE